MVSLSNHEPIFSHDLRLRGEFSSRPIKFAQAARIVNCSNARGARRFRIILNLDIKLRDLRDFRGENCLFFFDCGLAAAGNMKF